MTLQISFTDSKKYVKIFKGDFMNISYTKSEIKIDNVSYFNLDEILDCGQCFRFYKDGDSWEGVVFKNLIRFSQEGSTVIIKGASREFFDSVLFDYFHLDYDYGAVAKVIEKDKLLAPTARFAPGIRILKQQPFETLISFIISQNNNIKRIKSIVKTLCEHFGEDMGGYFAFPTPERLADATVADLAVLRAGFRDKYILDAAKKVVSGEVNLEAIYDMSYDDSRAELIKILGVGVKVADCVLLYGYRKLDAFPLDVWMKRAMAVLYPDGLPDEYAPFGGIVQQYIFHYIRHNPEKFEN